MTDSPINANLPVEHLFGQYRNSDHALNILMALMALEWSVGDYPNGSTRAERVASLLKSALANRVEHGPEDILAELSKSLPAVGIDIDELYTATDLTKISEALLSFADDYLER
jgi:hypothetical protein